MRAKVKGVEGLGRDEPESYVSPDPANDAFWLRMLVGPSDRAGEETFDVLVCTPLWLADTIDREGPQLGRHRLVVGSLDLAAAEGYLRAKIEDLEASSWTDLASKIGRIGYWEFEDYRAQ